jgi:hypothetical protein
MMEGWGKGKGILEYWKIGRLGQDILKDFK